MRTQQTKKVLSKHCGKQKSNLVPVVFEGFCFFLPFSSGCAVTLQFFIESLFQGDTSRRGFQNTKRQHTWANRTNKKFIASCRPFAAAFSCVLPTADRHIRTAHEVCARDGVCHTGPKCFLGAQRRCFFDPGVSSFALLLSPPCQSFASGCVLSLSPPPSDTIFCLCQSKKSQKDKHRQC